MSWQKPRLEILIRAEELRQNGKPEEALEIITNFEKTNELPSQDQLSILLFKGMIYGSRQQLKEAVELGERAYLISQELGLIPETIEALNLRSSMVYLGKPNEALNLILEAERLSNSLSDESSAIILNNLLYTKSWIYFYKSDFNRALELALKAFDYSKTIKDNYMIGYNLILIGVIYLSKEEYETALEYTIKSLNHFKQFDMRIHMASSLFWIGQIYLNKGDLNKALECCEKSLSIENIGDWYKAQNLALLGSIYSAKGELNKALKYAKQSTKLAERISNYLWIIINKLVIGGIYRIKGESNQAIKYYEQSLLSGEKIENTFIPLKVLPLLYLLLAKLDINSHEQAQKYLKRLENISNQYEIPVVRQAFLLGKAFMLRASRRIRDHADSAELLKQIVEDDMVRLHFHTLALISLCEFLIEELSMYDNPEVLDEINPLIKQLLTIAENQHSFSLLAESKLLQAKFALIQMNIEEAKQMLTEAQNIAETYGLGLLAQKISNEHDHLLGQLDEWQKLKNNKAPISDRIKLASFDSVIGRLKGESAIDPPDIIDEQPTLLLIIAEGGVLIFSHPFTDEWKRDDELFSSFLSAFTSFSDEFFSEELDRVKFGQYTVLLEPVGSFSVCYLYKGQTYPAMKKLRRFIEQINNSTPILLLLEKYYKNSQVLELRENPQLEYLITEIFASKGYQTFSLDDNL